MIVEGLSELRSSEASGRGSRVSRRISRVSRRNVHGEALGSGAEGLAFLFSERGFKRKRAFSLNKDSFFLSLIKRRFLFAF